MLQYELLVGKYNVNSPITQSRPPSLIAYMPVNTHTTSSQRHLFRAVSQPLSAS